MAAQNHMHNLTTLIKRLEAATSRLEDIASSTELPKDVPGLAQPATPLSDTAVAPLPPTTLKEPQEAPPESIEDFDVFLNTSVDKYVKLSNQLGGVIAQQASEVLKGFREQRRFLLIATKAAKPGVSGSSLIVYQNLLKPITDALMAATEIKEANRPDPMYSNLSAVADGVMVLGWVTVDHRPFSHVEESLSAAQFFGNRVLKEQKDNDPRQVDWIQSFYQIFHDLGDYVKQHHASGVAWNPRGEPAEEVAKSLDSGKVSQQPLSSSGPSAGAAPPPPPPPPPPGPPPILDVPVESAKPSNAASAGGFGAVFSELNRGEDVTKGLRKVDRSEMTHKNPALRAGSTVSEAPRAKSPVPGKKPKPESMRVKKPARKVLEANKWTVENYEKEPQPVEIEASLTHSVLISRCNNTTVIIKGKANQVTVENSTRLSLVVDTLVSTVDVVKASNFALQILGTVPTVMLDQIDSAQVYLSKESVATKLFTSKSAGINLNIISGPEDDYKELPLPSQICSYYSEEKGDLVSEIVAHAG
ncbi:adenylyl cyclase-associated [Trichoderma arundinaceum]|uniref:Adenylyl cyclase-associated protein n=1 Tax=Trichoderma arundinaceum TaxID=490622 RepID=A0A395NLP4_TRIAR|nr:adenylyl cyclase-associated [Trichoderma arundinaceum]